MDYNSSFSIPEHFSTELLLHTFSFLDPASLGRSGCVCRQWRDVHEDESLWQLFFEKTGSICKPISNSWRKHYLTRLNWKKEKYSFNIVKRPPKICHFAAIDGKHYEVRTNQKKNDTNLYVINVTEGREVRTNFTSDSDSFCSLNGPLLTFGSKKGDLACLDITTGTLLFEADYGELKNCETFYILAQETNFIMILKKLDGKKELVILDGKKDPQVVELPASASLDFRCSSNFILVRKAKNQFMRFNTAYEATDPMFVEEFNVLSNEPFAIDQDLSGLSEKYTAFVSGLEIVVYENNSEEKKNVQKIALSGLFNMEKWNLSLMDWMVYSANDILRPLSWDIKIIDEWLYFQMESQFFVFDIHSGELISSVDTIQKHITCPPFDLSARTDGNILIFETQPMKAGLLSRLDTSEKHYLILDYSPNKSISLTAKIQGAFQSSQRQIMSSAASLGNQASGLLAPIPTSKVKNWFKKTLQK